MEITAEMIDYPSNQHTTPGYLARPDDEKTHQALVAIQEFWGLVPHIKDVAGRFAREGYITLAPDLYYGEAAVEPDEARKLAMELDRDRAVEEIVAAIRYLDGLVQVQPKKVGVVGWCMGGSLAVATAASGLRGANVLGAVVVFYGMPRDLSNISNIQAPLLGLYGEQDHGIPPASVHELEGALEENGIKHEIHIYPGAGHAFFNDTRPQAYNPKAAQDAWQRTLLWFHEHLR
jgi:carboxymethylenebutenolidase